MCNTRLKVAIIESGQKAYQVAHQLHWHPTKLSQIVIGVYSPSDDEKLGLANILDKNVDELFPDPVESSMGAVVAMPRKPKQPEVLPEIHVVEFEPGEFKPLYVAADKVDRVVIGPSKKAWSNWRWAKTGPRYYLVGGKPYYRISDIEEYFGGNPVQTTGKP